MSLVKFLQDYRDLFSNNKEANNSSKNTTSTYKRIINQFCTFVTLKSEDNENFKLKDINRHFLDEYLIHLKNNNASDSTRQLHITVLKNYLWFIADTDKKLYGFLRKNIDNVTVKTVQKNVEIYTDLEQKKIRWLISKLDESNKFREHRIALILKLLLFHGIRIDELINLTWDDVREIYDEQSGYLYNFTYMGKGSKQRDLDFPTSFVEKNFEVIRKHNPSRYVIPSNLGNRSSRANIYNSIKNALKKLDINEVWLHKFRHTFGKNKEVEGVSLSTISDLMGHSSVMTTSKYYLRNNSKAKRNAILNNLPDYHGNIHTDK